MKTVYVCNVATTNAPENEDDAALTRPVMNFGQPNTPPSESDDEPLYRPVMNFSDRRPK